MRQRISKTRDAISLRRRAGLSPARLPAVRSAFTIVELSFGLMITALVMAALASFALAMSTAWQSAGSSQSILLSANHDSQLLAAKIRPCGLTGGWRQGSLDGSSSQPAAVLLWVADTNADTYVNYSEILLIEHDPSTQRINLYKAPVPLLSANVIYSYSSLFSNASFIDAFKMNLTPTVLCRNVIGAEFFVAANGSATARPMVEYALRIQSGNQTQVVYGDAVLRAPLPVPGN